MICYGPAPYRGHIGCFDMQMDTAKAEFSAWFEMAKDMSRKDVQSLFADFFEDTYLIEL